MRGDDAILGSGTVSTDCAAAVPARLPGGDFADGVIAHQGGSLGGTASFDRRAGPSQGGGMEAADPSDLVVRSSPESGDRSSSPG